MIHKGFNLLTWKLHPLELEVKKGEMTCNYKKKYLYRKIEFLMYSQTFDINQDSLPTRTVHTTE